MLIKTKSQLNVIKHLQVEVFNEAKRVVTILDENYNDFNIDGGYVLIAENADNLQKIIGYYWRFKLEKTTGSTSGRKKYFSK